MTLFNDYWYFTSALSKDFCNHVINYANSKKEELALTGSFSKKAENGKTLDEKDLNDLKQKRDSNIVWLNDRWLYDEIHPFVFRANENSGWNFEWDYSESIQFTKYKLNQYYEWHQDNWDRPYGEDRGSNMAGKMRKLSLVVQLSDPKDYEGGDFEVCFRNNEPGKPENIKKVDEFKPQGSVIVFPSFLWHRVTSVTSGTRYSLVCWNLGRPFR